MGTPPPATNARESTHHVVAAVFREEWGRIVAALIQRTGDWDLSEECAQDALYPGARPLAQRRSSPPGRAHG